MYKFTLYVPTRDNVRAQWLGDMPADFRPNDHVRRVRQDLRAAGFDGWTETHRTGVWRDDRESVLTFEIISDDATHGIELAAIARTALVDQDAVLITREAIDAVFIDPREPVHEPAPIVRDPHASVVDAGATGV